MKNRLFYLSFLTVSVLIILPNPSFATISLEPYCKNGYYQIPGEKICSRAPLCGGYGYDELNTADKMPNAQECMGDGDGKRIGCKGWVPLCCYELERTGNYMKCIGYWERLWCHPDQCKAVNFAENCSHAFQYWCKGADSPELPIPLEVRLGLNPPQPTATPQPTIKPTSTPQPTTRSQPTVPPGQPTLTNIPTTIPPTPSYSVPTTPPTYSQPKPTTIPKSFQFPAFNRPTNPPDISSPQQPSSTSIFNFPQPQIQLPQIKISIVPKKIEDEVGKTLGFFEYIFQTIIDLDLKLETTVNDFLFKLNPF